MSTDTAPEAVQADEPTKAKKSKAAPKPPKDKGPFGFGPNPEPVAGYKMPAELPKDKTGLRQIVRASGVMNAKAASYLTPGEITTILKGDLPKTMAGAFGVELPEKPIRNLDDVYAVAQARKAGYAEREAPRAKQRAAERSAALGEIMTKFPGRDKENRIARLKAILEENSPWVPVTTEAARAEGRVYDVDGMAGRTMFYTIAPQAQLKQDGSPRANAPTKLMSPQVYEDLIKGDAELEALVVVPEGFNVAPVKEPKPKAEGKKSSKKRTSNSDALASADEAAGSTEPPAEGLDDALATAPAGTTDEIELPDL